MKSLTGNCSCHWVEGGGGEEEEEEEKEEAVQAQKQKYPSSQV
jgi:hypothetical protein